MSCYIKLACERSELFRLSGHLNTSEEPEESDRSHWRDVHDFQYTTYIQAESSPQTNNNNTPKNNLNNAPNI